jgi:hypothetical protein
MAKPAASAKPAPTDARDESAPPAAAGQGVERAKVLSVRLSADEFERLTDLATEIGVGPSTLARTFIRRGLTASAAPELTESPLERAHLERLPHRPHDIDELVARIAALEAWVESHSTHGPS